MSIIKQISVYNGSTWQTDQIGANAANISLSTNAAGGSNVQTALNNLVGTAKLTGNKILSTDSNGKIVSTLTTAPADLQYLSGISSNIQTQLNNKIARTGDTGVTGNYTIIASSTASANPVVRLKSTGIESGKMSSTAYQTGGQISFFDKNNKTIGAVHSFMSSGTVEGVRLIGWGKGIKTTGSGTSATTSYYYNGLALGVRPDNTPYVALSTNTSGLPAAWRDAIGAASSSDIIKNGGTITGHILSNMEIVDKGSKMSSFQVRTQNITTGRAAASASTATINGNPFWISDRTGEGYAALQTQEDSSRNAWLGLYVRNRSSSSSTTFHTAHTFYIGKSVTGADLVYMSNPKVWREALKFEAITVAFTNSTAPVSSTNWTLSPNLATVLNTNTDVFGVTSNYITVKEAGQYIISGQLLIGKGFTQGDIVHVGIWKGTSTSDLASLGRAQTRVERNASWDTLNISPYVASISANQKLYVRVCNETGGRGQFFNISNDQMKHKSFITVQRIR